MAVRSVELIDVVLYAYVSGDGDSSSGVQVYENKFGIGNESRRNLKLLPSYAISMKMRTNLGPRGKIWHR